ncbi:hypothetical protein IP91_01104 [Pseudoduganella lurida]|uniref:DUF2239 family protein n=1 Tax=Pseudoduganella lurida TaxID=1036180 RepID=A0A562RNN9_9BURK|nr:DUF2239 family protein [Pseudoduganella lurida]TWI70026.1 hypothetical protein IP91_01104 [Pseudoduganella lurida]
MTTSISRSVTAFAGFRRIAYGTHASAMLAVKHAMEAGATEPLLLFDDSTGRVLEVDVRGSDAEALARLPVASADAAADAPAPDDVASPPRGRGRPKLGVIAREVTLLPRHWDWLSAQPGGASVALRKLVDEARRASAGHDERRAAQERTYRFISAIAGDLPGFEESTRALFADDIETFGDLAAAWPGDVREYALRLAASPAP